MSGDLVGEPLALDLPRYVDVEVPREEQELAEDVGELQLEGVANLLGRLPLHPGATGHLQVGLGELADLLLKLEKEPVTVPLESHVLAIPGRQFLQPLGQLLDLHRPNPTTSYRQSGQGWLRSERLA